MRTDYDVHIVFRTFGVDIGRVAAEFNCFCEGRHPVFHHPSYLSSESYLDSDNLETAAVATAAAVAAAAVSAAGAVTLDGMRDATVTTTTTTTTTSTDITSDISNRLQSDLGSSAQIIDDRQWLRVRMDGSDGRVDRRLHLPSASGRLLRTSGEDAKRGVHLAHVSHEGGYILSTPYPLYTLSSMQPLILLLSLPLPYPYLQSHSLNTPIPLPPNHQERFKSPQVLSPSPI